MSSSKPPLILIAGPTASGKSALAFELAQQINGVIVNADSAQIYRDLRILSAAPSADQRARVDHRLYGVADGATACSASEWAALARVEIEQIHGLGRTPILVGGTGLYIRTLLDGIAPVPPIDAKVRDSVRNAELAANRAQLEQLDPEGARRLSPGDTARINRALEVVLSTGRSLLRWQEQRVGGIKGRVRLSPLVLQPPRDWLYARCDERFTKMIEEGAVGEVETLLQRNLSASLPVMRAIGVPQLANYIRGHEGLSEATCAGQQATRRYAKRQYTWFAHQLPPDWPRFGEVMSSTALSSALALLGPNA